MLKLVEPSQRYLSSYREAYEECLRNNIDSYYFADSSSNDLFEKFDNYKYERNLKPGRVGATYFWLVDDGRDYFIGEISIRHELTESLLCYGGHVGYGIRYSEWNKGYGTLMLKLALEKAKEMGLSKVLITCDDDNLASAKVMENNGAVLQDKIENIIDGRNVITRRYWIVL